MIIFLNFYDFFIFVFFKKTEREKERERERESVLKEPEKNRLQRNNISQIIRSNNVQLLFVNCSVSFISNNNFTILTNTYRIRR
jgi:hypothetical protein